MKKLLLILLLFSAVTNAQQTIVNAPLYTPKSDSGLLAVYIPIGSTYTLRKMYAVDVAKSAPSLAEVDPLAVKLAGSYANPTWITSLAGSKITGLSTVATSGSYNDLLNLPTLFSGSYPDLINKPALFSGAYADLTGKPTIPASQVNSDWNAVSGVAMILNKPTLFDGTYASLTGKPTFATVATSGSYTDLLNKPTIPTNNNQLTNGAGYITGFTELDPLAVKLAGSYADPSWITSLAASKVGLGNVENTALSTWTGSTNITTLGTIATGTWNATAIGISKGGTGQTTASAGFNALSPVTLLGDLIYGSGANANSRLAGSTSSVKQFLTQTGNGTTSAAPQWAAIAAGDVPTLNQNTTGTAGGLSANIAESQVTNLTTDLAGKQNALGTINGILKSSGTTISAATVRTDYAEPTTGLATGILKNTTTTGAHTIAVAADFPTLNQNTTGTAAGLSANIAESQVTNLVSDLSAKEGTANKDATGGYAGLTLLKINFKNAANTFTSFFTNTNTAARTYTFQDRDGTIADNTDLAAKQNNITLTTTGSGAATLVGSTLNIPTPAAGGDFSTNTATSVDGEIVLFNGTTGKSGKRATGSGMAKITSGVLGTGTSGTDYSAGTSGLSTGILKSTTTTGALTIAVAADFPTLNQNTTGSAGSLSAVLNTSAFPALTGDVTNTAGSLATTIANSAVTYAKMQNVSATSRVLGRKTASAGVVEELNGTDVTGLLDQFTSSVRGVVPSSGGGTTNFLRADGLWQSPLPGKSSIVANSAAINTTETQITSAAITASYLNAGATYRVTAYGTTTSTAANASNFRVRVGTAGTTADAVAAVVTPTAATTGTSVPFQVMFLVTIRTTGTGGTMGGNGSLNNNGVTGVSAAADVIGTPQVGVAINTTVANTIGLYYVSAATTTTTTFNIASIELIKN